jgi:DNA-directed RNA polymerase
MTWISPSGFFCRQPYRAVNNVILVTKNQHISLMDDAQKNAPVNKRKQKLGFPPNFVHSLDASHMVMTAERCQLHGLSFASVHDSYWTHASDVKVMNRCLREAFVEIYGQKPTVLERLHSDLKLTLGPTADDLPDLPEIGSLDIREVLMSDFFFD